MKIILEHINDLDEDVIFDDKMSVKIEVGDMRFRITHDSLIIDEKKVDCLYINFTDKRGADRLHILPASANALHLTGGQ